MALIDTVLDWIGRRIAQTLEPRLIDNAPLNATQFDMVRRVLRPADVLLVEGRQKLATAIKYLTQSTWSHAALYAGNLPLPGCGESPLLIEANVGQGVVAVPLSKYRAFNVRICRPIGLSDLEKRQVVAFAASRLGQKYDMRHIFDLARYLFPTPPVPIRWRRRMIALGAGDPTRAICSTLIAQAFHSIPYPILPRVEQVSGQDGEANDHARAEILHIRHHSLFAPRDFDMSPYFQIVKPTIDGAFDPHKLVWANALGHREVPVPRRFRAAG
jgi:hypothetical protein